MPLATVVAEPAVSGRGGHPWAGSGARLVAVARRRAVPLAMVPVGVAATLVASMAFPAHPVPGHPAVAYWRVPADVWATLRAARTISWGDMGGVYAAGTSLVSLPGAALLLLPVALVAHVLGLGQSFPLPLPHPTAWWVLAPYTAALCGVALVAADALAERLGVGRRRRAVLAVAGAAVAFPVYGLWGHPEDVVAVGLLLLGTRAALDGRSTAAGWSCGVAVAVQPLVLLGLPVVAAALGWRRVVPFACRAAVPAVLVVAVPLVADPRATVHALVDQPNFPSIDHVTPWTALAPHLGGHGASLAVAAGPGRLVALALALGLAPLAARWRHRPVAVVWLVASGLALRVLTESVLDPYYLWPPLAVALVAAACAARRRWAGVALVAAATSALAELHMPWALWWLVAAGGVVVAAAVAAPATGSLRHSSSGAEMPLGDEGEERSARGCPAGDAGAVPAAG